MSNLCRLCLTESFDSMDLTDYREGLPISVLAMIILPIKIYDGEDFSLPQKICNSCLEIIISAYKLRDVSLNSEKVLKNETDVHVKSEVSDQETVFMESMDYDEKRKRRKSGKGRNMAFISNFPNPFDSKSCEYCGDLFTSSEELQNHITDEHFSISDISPSIGFMEGFHIDFYRKDRTPKSSKVWKYYGKLLDENNQHIGIDYHYCTICLSRKILTKYKKSTATSTLLFHLTSVHGIAKDDCGVESTYVREKYSQRKERASTSGPAVTATVCSECGKTFGSHHILKKHMKIHSGQFFPCGSCPAKFAYIENLNRHRRCHDPNHLSRFVCDMCGNRFAEMKSLRNHIMRVHLKIPPQKKFECTFDGCSLKFAVNYNLKKHMLTHTDWKPHECQFCDNAYTSKGDLVKHLQKIHVGDAIYHCEYCNEAFKFKIQLRDHYQIHYRGNEEMEAVDS